MTTGGPTRSAARCGAARERMRWASVVRRRLGGPPEQAPPATGIGALWRIATAKFRATWRNDSSRKRPATTLEGNPFKNGLLSVWCLPCMNRVGGRISHKEDGV